MKESKDLTDPEWNEYVDATIAFLQNDRKKFIELTQKENYNKETLERLSRNFGKPYEVAYED